MSYLRHLGFLSVSQQFSTQSNTETQTYIVTFASVCLYISLIHFWYSLPPLLSVALSRGSLFQGRAKDIESLPECFLCNPLPFLVVEHTCAEVSHCQLAASRYHHPPWISGLLDLSVSSRRSTNTVQFPKAQTAFMGDNLADSLPDPVLGCHPYHGLLTLSHP